MDIIRERKNNNSVALGGVIDECFYALSYLAKVYSKVRTPNTKGNRVFANSNIQINSKTKYRKDTIKTNKERINYCLQEIIEPIAIDHGIS